MADHEISRASTIEGLPVAPSLGPVPQSEHLAKSASHNFLACPLEGLAGLLALTLGQEKRKKKTKGGEPCQT